MLLADATLWARARNTVNAFRVAVLGTIAFLALLMTIVGLTSVAFDVSDRGMGVIGIVLTALTGLVGNVIVYLKVDGLDAKADDAKGEAAAARAEAQKAARIGEEVHHDIKNDVLKDKVRQAIAEERHMVQNRETAKSLRDQLEERGIAVDRSEQSP